MLWSRWMPARQTRCALGYPCHLQHLKFVPRRFPCLLPSHRWGRRQTAPRHAKLVASGLNTLPKLGRPFVHSIFKHMVVPVRSEANFFHLVWMKEKIRRERGKTISQNQLTLKNLQGLFCLFCKKKKKKRKSVVWWFSFQPHWQHGSKVLLSWREKLMSWLVVHHFGHTLKCLNSYWMDGHDILYSLLTFIWCHQQVEVFITQLISQQLLYGLAQFLTLMVPRR